MEATTVRIFIMLAVFLWSMIGVCNDPDRSPFYKIYVVLASIGFIIALQFV